MASINYFFKSVSEKFSFDDYVYGLNDIKKVAAVGYVYFNYPAGGISTGSYDKVDFTTGGISYTDTVGNFAKVHFVPAGVAASDGIVTILSNEEVKTTWEDATFTGTEVAGYLSDAINTHFTSSINQGPKITATNFLNLLQLKQSIPGSAGNTLITSGGVGSHVTLFSGSTAVFVNFSGGTDRTGEGEWAPTTGTMTAVGVKLFDNYIFSPKHYGHFSDMFYSPTDKYYFTNEIKAGSAPANSPPSPPAIVVANLTTGSYRLTSNTDVNLRMMARYVDGETSYTADETYYETL